MAAFGVITACYTNIAMTVTFQRDTGVLKRIDGTPLPGGVLPRCPGAPRAVRGGPAGGHHRRFRPGVLRRGHPHRPDARPLPGHARGRAGGVLRARARGHRGHPQRRCPPAIVNASILPLLFLSGHLHPVRQQHPRLDLVGRPGLPRPAFRPRDAGRVPRHRLRLERTSSSWPPGAWPGCCWPSASSAGSRGRGEPPTGEPPTGEPRPVRAYARAGAGPYRSSRRIRADSKRWYMTAVTRLSNW